MSTQPTTGMSTQPKTVMSTQPTTGMSTQPTTGMSTQPTTEMSTQPTTGMSMLPTTGMGLLPTTGMSMLPTTGMSMMLPTTGMSMLPTTGMTLLTNSGKITLPITGKVTMRTTSDMSLITTEETTLPTTVAPTSLTSELTTVSPTPTTTNPLTSLFRDCGAIGSHVKSGRLNSFKLKCAGERHNAYCMLRRNTTARIFVNLTSNVDATKVKTIVHARKNRDSYPLLIFRHLAVDDGAEGLRFLGIKEDACLHKNVDHCNIKSGEDVQYSYAAFIDPNFPMRRMEIKLEIRDDQDRNLACVRFPIEIIY